VGWGVCKRVEERYGWVWTGSREWCLGYGGTDSRVGDVVGVNFQYMVEECVVESKKVELVRKCKREYECTDVVG
jgi:hypothetical protein